MMALYILFILNNEKSEPTDDDWGKEIMKNSISYMLPNPFDRMVIQKYQFIYMDEKPIQWIENL